MMQRRSVDINPEDFLEEGGMGIMMDVIKFQQQGAIDLTKLVLEYCKEEEEITKNYIFEVFEEALTLLRAQFDEDYE